jgi:hypothetical protein
MSEKSRYFKKGNCLYGHAWYGSKNASFDVQLDGRDLHSARSAWLILSSQRPQLAGALSFEHKSKRVAYSFWVSIQQCVDKLQTPYFYLYLNTAP